MDQPSGLKQALYRHGHALYEVTRHSHFKEMVRTGLYICLLGFLIMLGLLKWMLLPPLPEGVHAPALAPRFITDQAPLSGKAPAAWPAQSTPKITPEPNPFGSSATERVSQAVRDAANAPARPEAFQWKAPPAPPAAGYWLWLKPLLISAEVIPVLFFLWIALRAYQISYRKRDWVMTLMGAKPSDISRLLYYRAGLIALGAAALGVGSFTLLSRLTSDVPALPGHLGWQLLVIMLLASVVLSALAYRFPPDDAADPML